MPDGFSLVYNPAWGIGSLGIYVDRIFPKEQKKTEQVGIEDTKKSEATHPAAYFFGWAFRDIQEQRIASEILMKQIRLKSEGIPPVEGPDGSDNEPGYREQLGPYEKTDNESMYREHLKSNKK